jgi:hypothetical protein
MKTYTRRRTKIKKNFALLQESILLVQLDQLERSTGSVALLLRKPIPFIQTTFSVLEESQYKQRHGTRANRHTFFWIAIFNHGRSFRRPSCPECERKMSDKRLYTLRPQRRRKKKVDLSLTALGFAVLPPQATTQSPGTKEHVT